jgi:hypothetical protein
MTMILAMRDMLLVTTLRKSGVTGPQFRQEQEVLAGGHPPSSLRSAS